MPASTHDILGVRTQRKSVPPRWSEHFKNLTQLQNQLLRDKQTLSEDVREGTPNFSEHMADAGTDSYDRDWALSLLSSGQDALCEIREALNRMVQGTYGICELTGQPIEAERLLSIPWTRFSAEAQLELESQGAVSRTHLGELGTYIQTEERAESEEGDEVPASRRDKETV